MVDMQHPLSESNLEPEASDDLLHSAELCAMCVRLLNSIPSTILLLDRSLRVVSVNQNFLIKSRLGRDHVIGRRLEDIFPAVIYQDTNFRHRLTQVFRTGQTTPGERMVYRTPGQATRTYYYVMVPLGGSERPRNALLLMEDITEITRLASEVRKAERHLAKVVECARDLVLSMHPSGQILTWNTAAEQALGYAEGEVQGRSLVDFCVESQRQILAEKLERVCWPSQTEQVEIELVGSDGRVLPISWIFSAMRDLSGQVTGLVGVGRDLTERRELEAKLRQSDKLAALGLMASGIGHELRNPLAVISSSIQLIREKVLPPEEVAVCIERIFSNATRMGSIIENLLRFARSSGGSRKMPLNLAHVVREGIEVFRHQDCHVNLRLHESSPDTPIPIYGNACLLMQLTTNLIQNAVNALGERGGNVDLILEVTDSFAVLLVTDTGCGIAPTDLKNLFDPFFTAMATGAGTGLGLSICHTIVQQHRGAIDVTSEEGHGTTVRVRLPLAEFDWSGQSLPTGGKASPRDEE